MKVCTALKLKNQLKGEIASLKDKLSKINRFRADRPPKYEFLTLFAELGVKIDKLVMVKAAIALANAGSGGDVARSIPWTIARLSEVKGQITWLEALNCDDTPDRDHKRSKDTDGNWEVIEIPIPVTVKLGEVERDTLVSKLKEELSALQEKLNAFAFAETVALVE